MTRAYPFQALTPPYVFTPVTPPAVPVFTPEEIRAGIRVDANITDEQLTDLANAALLACSRYCGRAWGMWTFEVQCYFAGIVPLVLGIPLVSVTVKYQLDPQSPLTDLTADEFSVFLDLNPPYLNLEAAPAGVLYVATYQAGSSAIPADVEKAVLSTTAWFFNQPDGALPETKSSAQLGSAEVPPMVRALLTPYRFDVRSVL
jgi:uncharacterized phiE125 gp8 family phage protein